MRFEGSSLWKRGLYNNYKSVFSESAQSPLGFADITEAVKVKIIIIHEYVFIYELYPIMSNQKKGVNKRIVFLCLYCTAHIFPPFFSGTCLDVFPGEEAIKDHSFIMLYDAYVLRFLAHLLLVTATYKKQFSVRPMLFFSTCTTDFKVTPPVLVKLSA